MDCQKVHLMDILLVQRKDYWSVSQMVNKRELLMDFVLDKQMVK